ncbi:MAG: restriction endonuclease subunit S [Bacteroidales bacterium]|nr:restriction endonuclease subunit S [Bacteroidales bacterium]
MNAQQLRNSILQQAILGKLVPQDSTEEPASVLLQRIRKEKERLVKEGKLKKKDLESKPIEEDEIPFEIPESWEWCRVADVIFPPKYGTSNKSLIEGAVPVLRMGNIQDGEIVFDKLVYSNNLTDNEKYNLKTGDLLFNRTNSAELVGKTGIYRGQQQAIYAGYLILLRPIEIKSGYLNFVLGSSYAHSYCQEVKTIGVQQCNINAEKISSFCIPLPPLAEQRRIVAKIEELMPLVERYGKAQQTLDQLNESLPARLRQSILQEAIQGRLVPQDPKEEPASELLKRIRKEKEQLVKEGKLKKKDLESKPIEEDEIPFEIPESWEWVRLKDAVYNNGQKVPDKRFSYIDIGSIDNKRQRLNEKENIIDAKDAPSRARRIVKKDDIVYSTVRPYLHNVAIVDKEFSEEPIASTGFAVFSCFNGVYNKFLFYYLLSPEFDKYANDGDNAKGVAYPAINDEKLYKAIIPLPPLSEQKRIVAKVEELFGVMG